ncbi:UNVERIFIED_CONTAM: Hepatocyte nuclear factor 3-beta [Siphonaria sp. JEL0065]|nr:Hepatocyte nuclear factor 3-beta [Siphonaria sp. JEL0065]
MLQGPTYASQLQMQMQYQQQQQQQQQYQQQLPTQPPPSPDLQSQPPTHHQYQLQHQHVRGNYAHTKHHYNLYLQPPLSLGHGYSAGPLNVQVQIPVDADAASPSDSDSDDNFAPPLPPLPLPQNETENENENDSDALELERETKKLKLKHRRVKRKIDSSAAVARRGRRNDGDAKDPKFCLSDQQVMLAGQMFQIVYRRPPISYAHLITYAIAQNDQQKLKLQAIYTFLVSTFGYFRNNPQKRGWENSIRHNLSMKSKCRFRKVKEEEDSEKGCFWSLNVDEPHFRESIENAWETCLKLETWNGILYYRMKPEEHAPSAKLLGPTLFSEDNHKYYSDLYVFDEAGSFVKFRGGDNNLSAQAISASMAAAFQRFPQGYVQGYLPIPPPPLHNLIVVTGGDVTCTGATAAVLSSASTMLGDKVSKSELKAAARKLSTSLSSLSSVSAPSFSLTTPFHPQQQHQQHQQHLQQQHNTKSRPDLLPLKRSVSDSQALLRGGSGVMCEIAREPKLGGLARAWPSSDDDDGESSNEDSDGHGLEDMHDSGPIQSNTNNTPHNINNHKNQQQHQQHPQQSVYEAASHQSKNGLTNNQVFQQFDHHQDQRYRPENISNRDGSNWMDFGNGAYLPQQMQRRLYNNPSHHPYNNITANNNSSNNANNLYYNYTNNINSSVPYGQFCGTGGFSGFQQNPTMTSSQRQQQQQYAFDLFNEDCEGVESEPSLLFGSPVQNFAASPLILMSSIDIERLVADPSVSAAAGDATSHGFQYFV